MNLIVAELLERLDPDQKEEWEERGCYYGMKISGVPEVEPSIAEMGWSKQ